MSDTELTWDKVTARLLQEYDTRAIEATTGTSVPPDEHVETERALKAKVKGRCFLCGKKGHYKRNCRSRNQNQREGGSGTSVHRALLALSDPGYRFLIDSGATCHMVGSHAL